MGTYNLRFTFHDGRHESNSTALNRFEIRI